MLGSKEIQEGFESIRKVVLAVPFLYNLIINNNILILQSLIFFHIFYHFDHKYKFLIENQICSLYLDLEFVGIQF